jgi:hypothetical protein
MGMLPESYQLPNSYPKATKHKQLDVWLKVDGM